jgi:hypothetical protein
MVLACSRTRTSNYFALFVGWAAGAVGKALSKGDAEGGKAMTRRELVLCVGMHRSGTSLTASLLEAIGLALPGDLIGADVANPSGYFENRSVVDAQERLLRDLGCWWPTEQASQGLAVHADRTPTYRAHVAWLKNYLAQLFSGTITQLAIKDPRTSLLLPAWVEASNLLSIDVKLVICLRQPQDVCWSLVWRDGPSVGMGWSRAQRLWLEHYRAVLLQGRRLPAQVAVYETWLEPAQADHQLLQLAAFLSLRPNAEQIRNALERIKPELNHGGGDHLPPVNRNLVRLHAALAAPKTHPGRWPGLARRAAAGLKIDLKLRGARIRLHLLWLHTPWGRRALSSALDPQLLRAQLGCDSLRLFRRNFPNCSDLRPHPLISPAHLNRERALSGLPPLRRADDLFRHLLHPDLIPLNPHPWFDCRTYQWATHSLAMADVHPVLAYLGKAQRGELNPYANPSWLEQLGAGKATETLEPLPPLLKRLHSGLIMIDPVASLGDPCTGVHSVIKAHEAHWAEIREVFALWPKQEPLAPLQWLNRRPGHEQLGITLEPPGKGWRCWWLPGDWPAPLLAGLAGADPKRSQRFQTPETLVSALASHQETDPPALLALTLPVLAQLLERSTPLPPNVALLNLVWPDPNIQAAWLHLLAEAALVIECRPAVRAYLQAVGLRALWCTPPAAPAPASESQKPHLLLAMDTGPAEALLASQAHRLDANRYSAYFRLDAQLVSLGDEPEAASCWLDEQHRSHGCWRWLSGTPQPDEIRSHALLAWARQHCITVTMVEKDCNDSWLEPLLK